MKIPLMIPSITEVDIENAVRVLRSGQLIQGKEVDFLEKSIAGLVGTKHAICASNGTATLHLALVALGIGPGDEVIVPAFSYIATANVVELVGAKPVFVDIEPDTFCINASLIASQITNKTKAIMPVHEFGLMADMDAINQIAVEYNLHVIEDAACALGAKQKLLHAGATGHIGSFSFHPRKAITSGEGGVITTNDDNIAHKLRVLRNHGIEYHDGKMEFTAAGFNYRLTDFQAALMHNQLTRLQDMILYKNNLASQYATSITNASVQLPLIPEQRKHTWQTFHIIWSGKIGRNEVIAQLLAEGIGTNYGAQCIPAQKYYQAKYRLNVESLFPNANKAYNQGIALPIYDKLTHEEVNYVSEKLNKIK